MQQDCNNFRVIFKLNITFCKYGDVTYRRASMCFETTTKRKGMENKRTDGEPVFQSRKSRSANSFGIFRGLQRIGT